MSDNSTNTDLLIQYLDGELPAGEIITLEEKIAADPGIAAELNSLRLTKESIKSYGLKMKIGTIHQEMMKEMKMEKAATKVVGIGRILQYSARIAAAVIVLVSVTVLYQYFSATPEKLYQGNYEVFALHETRGVSDTSFIEKTFKEGHYDVVMEAFKKTGSPQPQDYFLNGNAALQEGNAPEAIRSFMAIEEQNKKNSTHFFEEDTQYYLALAWLLNNEPGKALPVLEKIYSDNGHSYHKKISAWFLTRLRRLTTEK